jgi:hypothetical protein
MYLDPGSTSLFVQALFALFATALATFSRSREWIVAVWARISGGIHKSKRRTEA